MKDENKNLFPQDVFTRRVKRVMKEKSISLDALYERVNSVGYEITKNNLSIYIQRAPNVNFLIALSKALDIPADYLLGLSDDYLRDGFDYKFDLKRYRKYNGDFFFYFFPTVSNSPTTLEKACLRFNPTIPTRVELDIPVDNNVKQYTGSFLLSDDYSVGYASLKGVGMGEWVFLSFLDPVINRDNTDVQLLAGAMLSVSSGDFKRVPVMSRFILSKREIPESKVSNVIANLRLNSKYILVFEDRLQTAISSCGLSNAQVDEVMARLTSAFANKGCFMIEESYILNTLKNDCKFSTLQAIGLLDSLRNNSYSQANSKLNRTVDARMYNYIFGDSEHAQFSVDANTAQ